MSASELTCFSMTACHCGKSYHQQKRAWEEHVDLIVHSASRSEHNLGLAMCLAVAGLTFIEAGALQWIQFALGGV